MKHLKPYNIFETANDSFTAYHTSFTPIDSLSDRPMWFTKELELAKEYHKTNPDSYTYEVKIHGKILTSDELKEILGKKEYNDLIADLTANPTESKIVSLIKPFIGIADGFDQWDYDPRDPQYASAESTLVFNPSKSVTINKRIL